MMNDTSYSLNEQQQEPEIRLSLSVMHVPDDPDRRAMLVQMERAMGGIQQIRQQVLDYQVIRDVSRKGVWPTARLAWARYHPKATHHLVLQDDMLPCKDFLPGLKKLIAQRPEHCINLFSMRKIVQEAFDRGDSWCVSKEGIWGGTTIIPTAWIDPYLRWCRKYIPESYPHDDRRLMFWLYSQGHDIWQTVPCLLEHIGADKSLVGHNNKRRVATVYLDKTSPFAIDWRAGIEKPLQDIKPLPEREIYDAAMAEAAREAQA